MLASLYQLSFYTDLLETGHLKVDLAETWRVMDISCSQLITVMDRPTTPRKKMEKNFTGH
jgi:hypothetical protein